MKRLLIALLCALLLCTVPSPALACEEADVFAADPTVEDYWLEAANFEGGFGVKSAYLCEATTGTVMYAVSEELRLPIASVTKVMSMLLVMEAVDGGSIGYDDMVTVSDFAASMGGSQVFLESGEQMSVSDMIKAIAVASANDATVAMAEHLCGSEAGFVTEMNKRAVELGCENTNFVNSSGLPEPDAYSSAKDVALITAELLKHPDILKYTGIWMDSLRNGAFGLANTNKLIRFYPGANGMKTGFTDAAKYCLSGTAMRDGMTLIAVVLGGETSNERFACAKGMLDFGFANYKMEKPVTSLPADIRVTGGRSAAVGITVIPPVLLTEKRAGGKIESTVVLNDSVQAPVAVGDSVGYVIYTIDGNEVARADITASEDIPAADFFFLLGEMLKKAFLLG